MTSETSQRKDYMRGAGFLLASDVGHQFFDDMLRMRASKAQEITRQTISIPTPDVALHGVSRVFWKKIGDDIGEGYKRFFSREYGVTDEDYRSNLFYFKKGLGDQEFTWHFAPTIASELVTTFHRDGLIDDEQRNQLTLGDWADMIGSGWFSNVIHNLALTDNGSYGGYGWDVSNYGRLGSLATRVGFTKEAFETSYLYDSATDLTFATGSLTNAFTRFLRNKMQKSDSPGCPVARHAGTLSTVLIKQNQHAQNMIRRGDLELGAMSEDGKKTRFRQEYTPIDRSLDVLAALIDRYEAAFGTPVFDEESRKFVHKRLPKTNALVLPGNQEYRNKSAEPEC